MGKRRGTGESRSTMRGRASHRRVCRHRFGVEDDIQRDDLIRAEYLGDGEVALLVINPSPERCDFGPD